MLLQLEDFSQVPYVVMDSARILDGTFRLNGYAREGMYRLRLPDAANAYWVIYHKKGSKFQLDLDADNLYLYTASGNPETVWLADMAADLKQRRDSIGWANVELDAMLEQVSDSVLAWKRKQLNALTDSYKQAVKRYIEEQPNPALAAYAMTFYGDVSKDIEYFIGRAEALLEKDPDAPFVKQVYSELKSIRDRVLADHDKGLPVGSRAPEIRLPSFTGDTLNLSMLKGKYVLLDFWASWCQPCREVNPFFVELYKKYNARGFEIFSVSLDRNAEHWNNARLKDGLIWRWHVSDLKMWHSDVVPLYRINAIPTTYLIDPNGVIIGRNLHGRELEEKLEGVLKPVTPAQPVEG